jgi:hypothetical protein
MATPLLLNLIVNEIKFEDFQRAMINMTKSESHLNGIDCDPITAWIDNYLSKCPMPYGAIA